MALALVCAAALAAGRAILADDYEDPIMPDGLGMPVAAIGDVEVAPVDVGGAWIDAREAIEPQLSVLLMTGAVSVSPGMVVEVAAGPVFECEVSGATP
jgi:hypothetical protein